jgi:predicted permease
VRPIAGRTFGPGEDEASAERVVVLGEPLWRRRFGADASIVGRPIMLDGEPHTVIGIVPAAQRYPYDADIWTTTRFDARSMSPTSRGARWIRVIGRLRDGADLSAARTELSTIARRLEALDPAHNTGYGATVVGLQDHLVGSIRTPLLILLGAVGFVMLIACANVANLMLVRTAARETEIAVRTALGAGRARLVRQLVTESVVLSAIGGAAGLALAVWGTRLFVALAPDTIPRLHEVRTDGAMIAFTAAIALVTGTLFGLIPAMHGSASELALRLKEGGRGSRTRPGSRRARRWRGQ